MAVGRHYGGAVRRNYGYRGGGRNYGHRNYGHRNYGGHVIMAIAVSRRPLVWRTLVGLWRRHLLAMDTRWLRLGLRLLAK